MSSFTSPPSRARASAASPRTKRSSTSSRSPTTAVPRRLT
ncbi:hypothetical protein LINPERHAP1_LOCUS1541 [Linum perenne]